MPSSLLCKLRPSAQLNIFPLVPINLTFFTQVAGFFNWLDKNPHSYLAHSEAKMFFFAYNPYFPGTILFLTFALLFVCYIKIHRNRTKEKIDKSDDEIKSKFQALLLDYLFSDKSETFLNDLNRLADNESKRSILLSQIKDISQTMKGETLEKLIFLYTKLGFDQEALKAAVSKNWIIRLLAFRELAFMNITEANPYVTKELTSNYPILRTESQLALIRLDKSNPYSFLDKIQRPFTLWEQLNVHLMIIHHELSVPDFSRWLYSENMSVRLFCIRMIGIFKQVNNINLLIPLLYEPDVELQIATVNAFTTIKDPSVFPSLVDIYPHSQYDLKKAILVALAKIPDPSLIPFLIQIINNEEDVNLQIAAARAIKMVVPEGMEALYNLLEFKDKDYQFIIKCIIENRII
jgi:hypothetical protein